MPDTDPVEQAKFAAQQRDVAQAALATTITQLAKIRAVLAEQPNGMTLTDAEAHWRLGEIARIVRDA